MTGVQREASRRPVARLPAACAMACPGLRAMSRSRARAATASASRPWVRRVEAPGEVVERRPVFELVHDRPATLFKASVQASDQRCPRRSARGAGHAPDLVLDLAQESSHGRFIAVASSESVTTRAHLVTRPVGEPAEDRMPGARYSSRNGYCSRSVYSVEVRASTVTSVAPAPGRRGPRGRTSGSLYPTRTSPALQATGDRHGRVVSCRSRAARRHATQARPRP